MSNLSKGSSRKAAKLRFRFLSRPLTLAPVRDVELVEDAIAQMINQLIDRFRTVVEARTRRKYLRTGSGKTEHVLEMDRIVRRFAGNQN